MIEIHNLHTHPRWRSRRSIVSLPIVLDEDLRFIAVQLVSNMPAQFLMDIYLNIISILVLFVYDIENVWIILPMGTVLMAQLIDNLCPYGNLQSLNGIKNQQS